MPDTVANGKVVKTSLPLKLTLFVVLLFSVVMSTGCAYLKDRALDFADCFKADIGIGYGIDVNFKITNFVSSGVGIGRTWKAGFKGRHTSTMEDMHVGYLLVDLAMIGYEIDKDRRFLEFDRSDRKPGAMIVNGGYFSRSLFFYTACYSTSGKGFILPDHEGYLNKPADAFDIEVGVVAGVIGFRLGFSFGQFADFLLGWATLDIANDDGEPEKEDPSKSEQDELKVK